MVFFLSVNHRGAAFLSLTLHRPFLAGKIAPIWSENGVEKE